MVFFNFSTFTDYINSLNHYFSNTFSDSNILFVLSEFLANKNNKEIDTIFNDSDNIKLFITNEISKLYNSDEFSNHSKLMKIFISFL